MPRDSRLFFYAGQFSGVQTRSIVVAHAPLPRSLFLSFSLTSRITPATPFSFSLSLSLSLSRATPRATVFQLPRSCSRSPVGFKYAKRLFSSPPRLLPLFGPPRPHNYRVAGKYRTKNDRREATGRGTCPDKKKKHNERKKGDIAIRLVTGGA